MLSLDDTIAAISTPVGEGGIGLVRLSGPDAGRVLRQLFRSPETAPADDGSFPPRTLVYGHVVDPATGERVDEVLATWMPAPRTYTRQDVVEINAHGGIVPLRRILALCLRLGARQAEPGEFTARAFLNGRLDLAQAEAVLDVVRAKTEVGLRAAVDQLGGHLSGRIGAVRTRLLEALAYVEASLDFAEDEIPSQDIEPDLVHAAEALRALLAEAGRGMIYREGVRTAIVGRPNVGKSSLLNRLLRANRAIVTDVPGTTRDTLEETLNLKGVPIVLVDTAGITDRATGTVERLGIERSRAALAQADLALLVVEAGRPPTDTDRTIADLVGNKPAVVVLNKIDLNGGVDPEAAGVLDTPNRRRPAVPFSALTGEGLADLENVVVELVLAGQAVAGETPAVTNPRHQEALHRALEAVDAALTAHRARQLPDLVAIDLARAVHILGEITGQTASEELVEMIFARFCVGK